MYFGSSAGSLYNFATCSLRPAAALGNFSLKPFGTKRRPVHTRRIKEVLYFFSVSSETEKTDINLSIDAGVLIVTTSTASGCATL